MHIRYGPTWFDHDHLFRSAEDVRSLKRPSQRMVPAEAERALARRAEITETFMVAADEAADEVAAEGVVGVPTVKGVRRT
jgi:hypothetical protein